MNLNMYIKFRAVLIIAMPTLLACSGGSSDSVATSSVSGPATFTHVAALLESKCNDCHGANPIKPGVSNLANDAGLYVRLTTAISGAPSMLGPSCNGQMLVNKADPSLSLLPKIVGGSPPCAVQMPEGCSGNGCLSTAEVTMIQSWVDDGAPQN